MGAYSVAKERWPFQLAPQLTGKAQQAYAALSAEAASDYDQLKAAILRRYDINDETYRQRFRAATQKGGEAFRELATRLQDLARKWTRECTTVEELLEAIVVEQLIHTLPEDIRVWVRERKPKSSLEARQLADDYQQARRTAPLDTSAEQHKHSGKQLRGEQVGKRCHSCGNVGHVAKDCVHAGNTTRVPKEVPPQHGRPQGGVKCFNCQQHGHIAAKCPAKAALFNGKQKDQVGGAALGEIPSEPPITAKGTVASTPVNDILLDTGAAKSMLHTRVVLNESLTGEKMVIRCAHGDSREYPLARVTVEVAGKSHTLLGAVSDTLLASVLLGRDMPNLKDLIAVGDGKTEIEVLATTRAQARKQQEAEKERVAENSGATLSPVEPPVTIVEEEEVATFGAEFEDSLFQGGRQKRHMTRQERRRHNQQYVQEQLGGLENQTGVPLGPLDLSASELQSMQQADESLQAVRQGTT